MDSDRQLIEKVLKKDPKAQEAMYRRFAPKMYGVCLRFARNSMEAEDILQEGFIKIFTFLKDYRHEGSFEGWIRKTFVNTAINFYRRKSKELLEVSIQQHDMSIPFNPSIIENLSANELLELIQELPPGYRLVFNLNVIEGYTHKEIATLLGISENTSKSQLSRARATLQNKINKRKQNNSD
jgi:RNA polymerase sigma-70 factor (ECF subfamily)